MCASENCGFVVYSNSSHRLPFLSFLVYVDVTVLFYSLQLSHQYFFYLGLEALIISQRYRHFNDVFYCVELTQLIMDTFSI